MKTQLEKIVYKKIFAKSILARDEKGALELLKKVINQDKTDLLKVSFLKKVIYKLADRGETTRIEKYEPLPDNLLPFKEVKKKEINEIKELRLPSKPQSRDTKVNRVKLKYYLKNDIDKAVNFLLSLEDKEIKNLSGTFVRTLENLSEKTSNQEIIESILKNYEKIKKIIDEKFSIRLIINLLQNKHTNSKSVEYISKISENLFKKNNDNDIYLLASLLLTNTKLSAKRLVYLVDKVFNYETISYPAFQNPNIPESVIIKLAKFKGDKWLTAKTYLLNNKKLSTEILQILYDNIDANRSKKDILYDNFLFKIYTHPKVSRPLKQNIKDNYTSTSERYQKKDFLQRILKIDIEQNIDNFEDKLEDLKKIEKNNDKDKLKIFIKNITSKKLGALDRFIEALTFHGDLLDFFIKNLPLEIREYLARRIASKKDGLDKDITEKISLVLSQDPNISVLNNLLPEKYFMDDWKSEKLFENLVNRNIKKINEKLLNYDVSDFKSDYVFKNLSLSDDEEIANKAEKKLKLFKETKKRFLEMENYVKKINEEYDSSLDNIIEINKLLSNRNYANLDNFLNNLSNIEKQNLLDVLTSTKKIDDVSMSSQEKIKDYILEFLSDNTLASIVEETENIETIIAIFKKRLNQKLLNKFFSNDPILSNLSKNEKKDYYYKFYKELKKKDKDSDPIHFDELEDDDDEEIVRENDRKRLMQDTERMQEYERKQEREREREEEQEWLRRKKEQKSA